jgi:3-hydroxy-9,10-secoandrosta-1,3,5(10)-triene-9,17-dione monooxygenase
VQNAASQLAIAPLLEQIEAGAAAADKQRDLPRQLIENIKANPIMGYTAAKEIGGLDASITDTGLELEAVAACCGSTAWVLWNHLCTFHLFAGLLGPQNQDFLKSIVSNHEWVCFPAGASTAIRGSIHDDTLTLEGSAAFGSGARYAEWAGASFVLDEPTKPRFTLVQLNQPGVTIDADWFSLSLRASATDTLHYRQATAPLNRVVDFPFKYRFAFRDPKRPMISHRYREDWVALSDLWLGLMAVGVVQAALNEVCVGIKDRVAIMGLKVAERPLVQVNLGQAQTNLNAARDTVLSACREADLRIKAQTIPDEADYLRQLAAASGALQLCDESMRLLLRVMGGNGLREGPSFERRLRDFQAMPLHINAHQDRVNEQVGRHLLGLGAENPF